MAVSTYVEQLLLYVETAIFRSRKSPGSWAGNLGPSNPGTLPDVALDFDMQQMINDAVIAQQNDPSLVPKSPPDRPKRKPGRPRKFDSTTYLKVYLDKSEADMVDALAKERGISKSHLMRDLILIGLKLSADDVESAA